MAVKEPIDVGAYLPLADQTLMLEGIAPRKSALLVRVSSYSSCTIPHLKEKPLPVRSLVSVDGTLPHDAADVLEVDFGPRGIGIFPLVAVTPNLLAGQPALTPLPPLRVARDLGEVSLDGMTPAGTGLVLWGLPLVFITTDRVWAKLSVGTILRHRDGARGL